ncbi:nucleotide exchange factor GrpE [Clostridium thailandense]|uniref:nucleotide exchange factor GrpE n=1 Tax=Clostridium thailandense TaxID=2794346 RepID=UPI003988A89E
MLINICEDIEFLKKQSSEGDISKNLNAKCTRGTLEKNNFNNGESGLFEVLQSLEGINNEVIKNKNLLKSVLEEDYEVKGKCIEKIKSIINAYVKFYDYVDGIRFDLEKIGDCKSNGILNGINNILEFLEKEFSSIGIVIHKPKIGIDKFDKLKHELIKTKKDSNFEDDIIIFVKRKGFYYNDRNIRFVRMAKVITVLN